MRLFIAIELPADVKSGLAGLQKEIKGVRWLAPDQLHLTLLFLGELGKEQQRQLTAALSTITAEPFRLRIVSTGCFPHPRTPWVLWVGLEQQAALDQLAMRVRTAAVSCRIPLEERQFSPHITLGRIKQPESCRITDFLDQHISESLPLIEVCTFVLFQSILTQQGAIHQPVARFPPTLIDYGD